MTLVLIGKGPCFGGVKAKNRGQTGSRYIYNILYTYLLFNSNKNLNRLGRWVLTSSNFHTSGVKGKSHGLFCSPSESTPNSNKMSDETAIPFLKWKLLVKYVIYVLRILICLIPSRIGFRVYKTNPQNI